MNTSPPTIIKPSVGRVVWYYPPTNAAESGFARPADGEPHSRTSVPLVQEGQAAPEHRGHCEWMPFQKGQAKALDAIRGTPPAPAPVTVLRYSTKTGRLLRADEPDDGPGEVSGQRAKAAAMDFGDAIAALKCGQCVARAGWNGKGMFVYLNKGSIDGDVPSSPGGQSFVEGVSMSLFERGATGTVTRMPNINMRAASGATVTGWLASQTDMLAEDWAVVQD